MDGEPRISPPVLKFLHVDQKGKLSTPRDYGALVKLLPVLRNLVDGCGEVTLAAEEAECIRSLGFEAQSGRWKCPPLPPDMTRDNPLLERLSVGWGEWTPQEVIPKNESTRETGTTNHRSGESPGSQRNPVEWLPERNKIAQPTQQPRTEPDPARIEEVASKILKTLQRRGRPIPKRRLQQLLWRYPATVFNLALRTAERRQHIFLQIK